MQNSHKEQIFKFREKLDKIQIFRS